jgi:ATP-dependent protease HslVU (ClpYQ) peptidase subunit
MGSDGQISCGDTIVETECVKIFRLPDGSLIGFAGNTYNWQPVLQYFKSKSRVKKWPKIEGHQDTLQLMPDGTIYMYDHEGRRFQRTAPVCIGSGWKYAVTAMDLTNDIKTAIECAIKRDSFSSGKITILSLEA